MIKIVDSLRRPVSKQEREYMSLKTRTEENLAFRSVRSLSKNIEEGNVLVAVDKNKIVGWIERYHIWNDWWGLSSLYVEPGYRDKGVGRQSLLPMAVNLLSGKNIYAATTNALVWKVLSEYGFEKTSLLDYPIPVIYRLWRLRYTNLKSMNKLLDLSQKQIHYFVRRSV